MARRGRKRSDDIDDAVERDNFSIANLFAPPLNLYPAPLTAFEDRRTFHPEDVYRPARSLSRKAFSDVVIESVKNVPRALPKRDTFKFRAPDKVLVCVRRQQRREVLHALRRTKKGSGARHRRRTYWSTVSCRR